MAVSKENLTTTTINAVRSFYKGETMQKCVWINVDLTPDDIANTIKDADTIVQESILYKLAKIYYNHPAEFKKQLQGIADSIKEDYSHDVRNMIRYMIQDIADYLGDYNE